MFIQSGPLENVTIRRDNRRSFAFITFKHEESVPYAEVIMENVQLYNRPLRLGARSSNKDFNNNANEPYTPEMYSSDSTLHRQTSWPNQGPPSAHGAPQLQQPLPVPLFTANSGGNYEINNNNYPHPTSSHHSYDDRMNGQRYDRRKHHSYHPYHRNEHDYSNPKHRNGNYNQQRRGGGYNNYPR